MAFVVQADNYLPSADSRHTFHRAFRLVRAGRSSDERPQYEFATGNIVTKLGTWCACACQCFKPPTDAEMCENETRPLLTDIDSEDASTKRSIARALLPIDSPQVTVAPIPKRRALLVGICYTGQCGGDLEELKGSHKDVTSMKHLLTKHFGYLEKDIVVMMDAPHVKAELQPNKKNIKREMRGLVKDAQPGDRFVFVFSGHSDQRAEKEADNEYPEEDGMDEVILTVDGKKIRDNKLYKLMVLPLPPGSGLFALIDSCHSGTMLDLPHYKCNAIYVPWISKGKRRTGTLRLRQGKLLSLVVATQEAFAVESALTSRPMVHHKLRLNTSVHSSSLLTATDTQLGSRLPLSAQNSVMGGMLVSSPICCDSPDTNIACSGWCHYDDTWRDHRPDVVSLSACTDLQQAWEDSKGQSLVHLFCEYISRNISEGLMPSYKSLMTHLNYKMYDKSVKVHRWTTRRKQQAKSQGKSLPGFGEAVNFQTPELSSLTKLDLEESFRL
ncbi:caspase domain-containing protein [Vararia minispora EC-137]|uniref:Caspase domain-containing protein n=1 Tax=Vararia minispora EC-137 TaxID=1314806 RepID=A0ACB8QKR0_9AGAM|nr:caspase domain-containing protein [Vararia minispora EC-137]